MKREFSICKIESAASVKKLVTERGLHPVVAKILARRNMTDEQLDVFLNGDLSNLHDPYQIVDMRIGTDIIVKAIDDGDEICVYGDYDPDGITGTDILVETLEELGAKVRYKLPDRHKEGYGMHPEVVKRLAEDGVRIILTVDNGIRAHHAIQVAKDVGLTVVVVDHHEPSDTLPIADAVININRHDDPYPFKGISGAAVAFKFVQVLYEKMGWPIEEAYKYLDLVAIAAIADVMPLVDESRIMVKFGLELMGSPDYDRIGLLALKQAMKVGEDVRAMDIGFRLAPALNAAGRLYKADIALECLMERDPEKAIVRAEALAAVNEERKLLTEESTERAFRRIEAEMIDDPIIVLLDRLTPEGIVGLVAGRVTEKYGKMSIVFTESEDQDEFGNRKPIYKASCRAPGGYHILEAIEANAEFFMIDGKPKFGGHAAAAGCTIPADVDHLGQLRTKLKEFVWGKYGRDLKPAQIEVDSILAPEDVTMELVEALRVLEPFGHANEQPQFIIPSFNATEQNFKVGYGSFAKTQRSHYRLMGKPNQVHVKVFGETGVDVAAWRMAADYQAADCPKEFGVVGTIEENIFQGTASLQITANHLLYEQNFLSEEIVQADAFNKVILDDAAGKTKAVTNSVLSA